jgi:hypothetical protein
MKKIVGQLSIITMLIAIIGAGILITAKPAHAHTSICDGPSCGGGYDGQDPIQSGCAGAGAVSQISPFSGSNAGIFTYQGHTWQVIMLYSSRCSTRWTQLNQIDGGHNACINGTGVVPYGYDLSVNTDATWVGFWSNTFCDGAYGNMVSDPLNSGAASSGLGFQPACPCGEEYIAHVYLPS